MTSSVKNNHEHMIAIFDKLDWFGRGRDNFRLFEQVYNWGPLMISIPQNVPLHPIKSELTQTVKEFYIALTRFIEWFL